MLDRIRDPKLVGVLVSLEDAEAFLVDGVSRTSRRNAVLFIAAFLRFLRSSSNLILQ